MVFVRLQQCNQSRMSTAVTPHHQGQGSQEDTPLFSEMKKIEIVQTFEILRYQNLV